MTNQLNLVFSWYFTNWLLGSLAAIRRMMFLFLTTADVWWFSLLFCFCQGWAGLRMVGLGAVLRISSEAGGKLWASAIKSLFWTGRKGVFSMKQILFFFYHPFFLLSFFPSFLPNTVITDSFLFGVSRKCLAAQRSKILMPAEHTRLFQLLASQISSVRAAFLILS